MTGKESRYYWLKLKDDFFLDKHIRKLRKGEAGDTAVIIYLKMMLIAMKNGGELRFEELEDNYYEELSLEINEDEGACESTLQTLLKCGLVTTEDGKRFFMPEVASCTGSESKVTQRVREHREREKALHCNTDETNCNTEIEKEIEKEIEIEIEIETETETDTDTEINNFIDIQTEEECAALGAAISLPLKNNKTYHIFNDEVNKWAELYQGVDVMQELRMMKGWLDTNPEKRKEKPDMPRFINAWLTRKQEKLSEMRQKMNVPVKQPAKEKEYTPDPRASYDLAAAERKMMMSVPKLTKRKR